MCQLSTDFFDLGNALPTWISDTVYIQNFLDYSPSAVTSSLLFVTPMDRDFADVSLCWIEHSGGYLSLAGPASLDRTHLLAIDRLA